MTSSGSRRRRAQKFGASGRGVENQGRRKPFLRKMSSALLFAFQGSFGALQSSIHRAAVSVLRARPQDSTTSSSRKGLPHVETDQKAAPAHGAKSAPCLLILRQRPDAFFVGGCEASRESKTAAGFMDVNSVENARSLWNNQVETKKEEEKEEENENENEKKSAGVARKRKKGGECYKRVVFMRHAQASHNVSLDFNNEAERDAKLTPKGMEQAARAKKLAESDEKIAEVVRSTELVVVSPLSRALQTCGTVFDSARNVKRTVVLELVREELSTHQCDRRSNVQTVRENGFVRNADFSQLLAGWPRSGAVVVEEGEEQEQDADDDVLWDAHGAKKSRDGVKVKVFGTVRRGAPRAWRTWVEPESELEARCEALLTWLMAQPESNIAVVSHANFLQTLFRTHARRIKSTAPLEAYSMAKRWQNAEMRCMYLGNAP